MSDYNELLDRAIEQLPPQALETKRFSVPKLTPLYRETELLFRTLGK